MTAVAWEVTPFDKKGRPAGTPVYVRARDAERAVIAGRTWMRVCMLNMRTRAGLVARRYYPERDTSITMYVSRSA